jgi:hypothetical protein
MQLREMVSEILEKKFSGSPRKMAAEMDLSEMDVRRLAGIEPGTRRNQEKLFRVILKLIPYCVELNLIQESDLEVRSVTERVHKARPRKR